MTGHYSDRDKQRAAAMKAIELAAIRKHAPHQDETTRRDPRMV